MKRRLLNVLTCLSLLLCVATCFMWVRSHRHVESIYFEAGSPVAEKSDLFGIMHYCGEVQVERIQHASQLSSDSVVLYNGRWQIESWRAPAGSNAMDYVIGVLPLRYDAAACPREPRNTLFFVGFDQCTITGSGFVLQTRFDSRSNGKWAIIPRPIIVSSFVRLPIGSSRH